MTDTIYMKQNEEGAYVMDDSPRKSLNEKLIEKFGKDNLAINIMNELEDEEKMRELFKKYDGDFI